MRLTNRALAVTTAAAFAIGTAITAAGAAPAEDASGVPTYKEFAASTYRDADGSYIVNGDEVLLDTGDLRQFYDTLVAPAGDPNDLVVNTVNGVDDKWTAAQVGNLTYCVSTKFGTKYATIVTMLNDAAAMWEGASSKVNFVHDSSQDGSCSTRTKSVVFSVEPVQTSSYVARAFFPSYPKRSRNVLVDDSIYTVSVGGTNVLAHELGHTLGFRHEHTRPEAGTCFEDNNWRPLTPYDKASIMHYPQCNGIANSLSFSAYDAEGVRALYGS